MGIESGDFIDLGHGQLHLLGQGGEVARGEMSVTVLNQVQVLDQKVAAARICIQERPNLFKSLWFDLAALGEKRRWPSRSLAASPDFFAVRPRHSGCLLPGTLTTRVGMMYTTAPKPPKVRIQGKKRP